MRNILLILFIFSSFSYGHSAMKGDLMGTWRLVEYAVDEKYQDVPNPTPIKMYMNGEFVIIFYLENKMNFNKGRYVIKDGKVTETILSSSTESLEGEVISFKPKALISYGKSKASELEKIEDIELLRAIDIGLKIKTINLTGDSFSIDVFEDYSKAQTQIKKDKYFKLYK